MYNVQNYFFRQDVEGTNGDIISFSVGELWLYFYKERVVACFDMRSKKAHLFNPAKSTDFKNSDGYTQSHEISPEIMDTIKVDMNVDDITYVADYTELTTKIFSFVCTAIAEESIEEFLPSR